MAELNKNTIKNLTQLSRIGCTEEEQESLLADLRKILNYIETLQSINTDNVPPCHQVLEEMNNVMRDDEVGETLPRELFLQNVALHVGGLVRVPTVKKQ